MILEYSEIMNHQLNEKMVISIKIHENSWLSSKMRTLRNHKYSAEIPIELWLGSGVLIIFNLRSKHDRFHSWSFKKSNFRCWPIKFPCFDERCTFLKILENQNHVFRIKITTISLGVSQNQRRNYGTLRI